MLSNEELLLVKGGSWSGVIIEQLLKVADKIFEYGRIVGTNLRRLVNKTYC